MITIKVTGDKKLDRALSRLVKGQKTIMRAGVNAGMKTIEKEIKAQVPRSIKSAISARFKKNKTTHQMDAKVGGGVGKQQTKTSQSRKVKRKQRGKSGDGIAKENVHWWLMGTTRRRNKRGANRGSMPAVGFGVIRKGYARAGPRIIPEMRRKMWMELKKQVAKNR